MSFKVIYFTFKDGMNTQKIPLTKKSKNIGEIKKNHIKRFFNQKGLFFCNNSVISY